MLYLRDEFLLLYASLFGVILGFRYESAFALWISSIVFCVGLLLIFDIFLAIWINAPTWLNRKRPWLTLYGILLCKLRGRHMMHPHGFILLQLSMQYSGKEVKTWPWYNIHVCACCGWTEVVIYKEPLAVWIETN